MSHQIIHFEHKSQGPLEIFPTAPSLTKQQDNYLYHHQGFAIVLNLRHVVQREPDFGKKKLIEI